MRRPSARTRGTTLLEAMVALLVMGIALVAIFGMLNHVEGANRSLSFQNTALDVFARVSAQIRDARCDYDATVVPSVLNFPTTDSGIPAGMGPWFGIGGPEPGSQITLVGDAASNPQLAEFTPAIRVEYQVTQEVPPDPAAPLSFRFDVRIRQIMRNAAQDAPGLTDGHWIRIFPVQKVCNPRGDLANARGEY